MTVDQLERPIVTKGLVSPTTVMATPMLGEVFLLDMARQGHLVGGRARTCSTEVGERLLESLSDHVREELIRYLKSYESKPAVLESEWGPVMILPYLMPAGSLAMVLLPCMKPNIFWKLAARDPVAPISLDGCLERYGGGRLRVLCDREKAIYGDFFDLSCRCRKHYRTTSSGKPLRIDETIAERLRLLSSLMGCPIRIERRERIIDYGDFDLEHFLCFSTVILSLAWRCTPRREAVFSLNYRSCGCVVSVLLSGWRAEESLPREIPWLDSFAARKQMIFDYTLMPDGLLLRFSPTVKDWSYLGLKQESQFCWGE